MKKKLLMMCCAALLFLGSVPTMGHSVVYGSDDTEITYGVGTMHATLEKKNSTTLRYTVGAEFSSPASSIRMVISLQKKGTSGWQTKATVTELDSNTKDFNASGTFDISSYGSGEYRLFVSGKDTTGSITTTWPAFVSNVAYI